MKRILIVDNDEAARKSLAVFLCNDGYEIDEAENEIEAMQCIESKPYDLVIADLCNPDYTCAGILQWIKENFPWIDVIIATSYGSIDCVVKVIKMGALNYFMKPATTIEFLNMVQTAMQRRAHDEKISQPVKQSYCYRVDQVIGVSKGMEEVLQTALKSTDFDCNVLIRGESGTGKELIARIIHNRNNVRRNKEFVAINCTAIPQDILESELFGYKRGAFTGAVHDHKGLIEMADGGTLLMDEIGDTTPHFQAKLLRVIQEKEIRRLGDNISRSVDVRIVAATNKDLKQSIINKTFREDLYYRLSVIDIFIPPLRERREDIYPLANYFIQELKANSHKEIKEISDEAMAVLVAYDWPGNVRELRNSIERAIILSGHDILLPEDFPLAYDHYMKKQPLSSDDEIIPLKEMERRYLLKAMRKFNYNQTLVAKNLGIGYTTLWRKLKFPE